ncbi:DUF3592 domain-containing protein [Gimesia alba]|nr:DUF3592 domain-containing protein [Gimesia alba]
MYRPRNFYLGILISPIVILVGLYFFTFHFLADLQSFYKFKDSAPTPVSRVLHVELVVEEGGEDSTEKVVVKYEYKYKGKIYTGDRASIYRGGDNFGSFQRDLYQKVKLFQQNKGGQLACYVNPQNPAESVLDNSFRLSRFLVVLVFSLVPLGMGLYIFIGVLMNKARYFESK